MKDEKTYRICAAEFYMSELTLGEMENLLALFGQLDIDIKLGKKSEKEDGTEMPIPEDFKKIKDLFTMGDLLSGLIKAVGAVGSAGLLSQLFSIILTRKDYNKKEDPNFFLQAKRSIALEVLRDFFTGEGREIISGMFGSGNSASENQRPEKKRTA